MTKSSKDNVLAIVKAGLHALAPEWGGALASLIDDYVGHFVRLPRHRPSSAARYVRIGGKRGAAITGRSVSRITK
jgi:hypothetical protein